jgi:hypothetical protein
MPVFYDAKHPETVAFPAVFSTWFAPGALVVVGLILATIGSFLLHWAGKPIDVPHIPSIT